MAPHRARTAAALRLAWGALLLLLSLLAVLPAPNGFLWKLSVGVTEWGYALAPLALLVLLPGWRRSGAGRLAAGMGVASALLFLSPLLRAVPVARELPERMEFAFGAAAPRTLPGAPARPAPLGAADLVRGVGAPPVPVRTRVYARRESGPLALDLYAPPRPHPPAPAVLVVHGGAWRGGTRADLTALNHYLAARGYVVASASYRLAPAHRYPAQLEDIRAALAYLRANAAELGVDPRRIVLLGRSAGGQLALLVAYTARDPSVRGVVSLYGPTDLPYGYAHPADPDVIDTRGVLAAYLGGSPAEVPAVYRAASPVKHVGPDTPPTLLVHGGMDVLVRPEQSARLARRLAEAGRPHLLLRFPWATHGCDFHLSGPCGQVSTYAVERFLAAVTRE
jgi:acetyl esterase/lipase